MIPAFFSHEMPRRSSMDVDNDSFLRLVSNFISVLELFHLLALFLQ